MTTLSGPSRPLQPSDAPSAARGRSRRRNDPLGRGIWPLASPALLITAVVVLAPLVYTIVLSFTRQLPTGLNTGFVGADNFTRMFNDSLFFDSLRITLVLFVVCLVIETVLGLGLGYLLSLDIRGRKIFLAAMLIPAITASVAVGLLWIFIYDPSLGLATKILAFFGLDPIVWLGDPSFAPWAIAIVDIWQWTPFMALIISAGIRSLPVEPFEAAALDGATGFRKAFHIGLPLLAPVLTVAMLLRTVDLVRLFDSIYVMTQGGPVNSTNTLNVYGYRAAFVNQDPSYAATLQVTLFLIVLGIAAVFTWARRRFTVEY
ncbi:sugar ABC transporter permease [Okibacterium endophyticum]